MRPTLIFLVLLLPAGVGGQESVPLTPAMALRRIDEKVTVEMLVKSAKDLRDNVGVVFLDSSDDYKSPDNLAVVINRKACGKFKEAGVTDIAGKFKDQKIRVTGLVVKKESGVQLIVSDPQQIVLVEVK